MHCLHLQQLSSIPILRTSPQSSTWQADPKQYLNHVQPAARSHYRAPLTRIFLDVLSITGARRAYPRQGAAHSTPGSQQKAPSATESGGSAGRGEGSGGRLSFAGSSRRCREVRGQGRRLQPQAGLEARNRIQTFALSLSHSAVPSPLSTCGLLLFLMLSATVFPLLYFCYLNEFSVTRCVNICKALEIATSWRAGITFICTCGIPKYGVYTYRNCSDIFNMTS